MCQVLLARLHTDLEPRKHCRLGGALYAGLPRTMGHHFQVDFFKSSLGILFTHVAVVVCYMHEVYVS